jgi:hypothetical protein
VSQERFERRLALRRANDRAVAERDELRRALQGALEALDALTAARTGAGGPDDDLAAFVDERVRLARRALAGSSGDRPLGKARE